MAMVYKVGDRFAVYMPAFYFHLKILTYTNVYFSDTPKS